MSKLRILYVSSEVDPFLNTSKIADFVRALPTAMQERGMEIRILVPRLGRLMNVKTVCMKWFVCLELPFRWAMKRSL
jgi:glycogen synthase